MLSKQAIREHQGIMKEGLGQDTTAADAEEQETRLLKFFELPIEMDQKNKKKQTNSSNQF